MKAVVEVARVAVKVVADREWSGADAADLVRADRVVPAVVAWAECALLAPPDRFCPLPWWKCSVSMKTKRNSSKPSKKKPTTSLTRCSTKSSANSSRKCANAAQAALVLVVPVDLVVGVASDQAVLVAPEVPVAVAKGVLLKVPVDQAEGLLWKGLVVKVGPLSNS